MRTTLDIDSNILSEVLVKTGAKSKKKAIETALKEFLEFRKRKELVGLIDNYKDFDLDLQDLEKIRNGD